MLWQAVVHTSCRLQLGLKPWLWPVVSQDFRLAASLPASLTCTTDVYMMDTDRDPCSLSVQGSAACVASIAHCTSEHGLLQAVPGCAHPSTKSCCTVSCKHTKERSETLLLVWPA